MKKALFLMSCYLLTTVFVVAQKTDSSTQLSPQALHDMYLQKRETNNTLGRVFLGSGIALTGTGFYIYFKQAIGEGDVNSVGGTLFFTGLTASLISIPFFIAARQNKNKAELALKNEAVFIGNKILRKSDYPALSLTIHF